MDSFEIFLSSKSEASTLRMAIISNTGKEKVKKKLMMQRDKFIIEIESQNKKFSEMKILDELISIEQKDAGDQTI